jgi:Rrf2 family iron-sulfur cluster assembly transcriptional regulator
MLTTKGRYAVMAMVDLAVKESDKVITLQDIAVRQQIALSYLEQIFAKLRKEGLVDSVKGPGGGYKLARQPSDISVAEVIYAADETIKMVRCGNNPEAGCMQDKAKCLTHTLWDGLGQVIHHYLASVSLADICAGTIPMTPPVKTPHPYEEVPC